MVYETVKTGPSYIVHFQSYGDFDEIIIDSLHLQCILKIKFQGYFWSVATYTVQLLQRYCEADFWSILFFENTQTSIMLKVTYP